MGRHISFCHDALRTTVHNTEQYSPAQLVFGHKLILYRHHYVDWERISRRTNSVFSPIFFVPNSDSIYLFLLVFPDPITQ